MGGSATCSVVATSNCIAFLGRCARVSWTLKSGPRRIWAYRHNLRSRRSYKFHLQSSIFDPEDRRTPHLRSSTPKNGWKIERKMGRGGRVRLLRRLEEVLQRLGESFDLSIPPNEEPPIFDLRGWKNEEPLIFPPTRTKKTPLHSPSSDPPPPTTTSSSQIS